MTKEEQFVNELIGYIFAYPDDDYMTMECLCRKLVKHGLLDKADGYYRTHEIRTNTHECVKDTHDKTEPTISKMEQVDKDINVRSKTENSSEKPNNCETCKHWDCINGKWECVLNECHYEPKDEPITQTETQNSNLTFKTLEYCDICDHKGCEECIANALDEHCMPSQFNKQIEDECAKEYEELGLKELKELIEADRKTENSSEIPNNCDTCRNKGFEGCEQPCLGCGCCGLYEPKDEPFDKDINVRSKTEPTTQTEIQNSNLTFEKQTDCSWK